ncbi:TetR/AcrR family transcriptional regulator [uncultured Methylobacterium sp.]|uniref:TetR/AcrR family transcriptional regulator n=1 Tax=uncultured Methylobacterium sp. TaxID=157278 RepID=UPI0035CC0456
MALSTSDDAGRYHHGDLRRALLDAGARLLRAGGVDAVTLREAARAAGVSHNAPYRHFVSREALLAAVSAEGFRDLRRRLEAADGGPKANAIGLGHIYLRFAAEERPHFLLMFGGVIDKADFPDLAEAAAAALAVLDRAVSGGGAESAAAETLRAWALVHGLAHLVAERQITPETARAVLGEEPRPPFR